MIITFPDGSQSTGPITVASNGTYTTTGNSNMSASWGFIAANQTGTYKYQCDRHYDQGAMVGEVKIVNT